MNNNQVLYVCGTDENAASIILEAQKQSITPQELCDINYPQQKETFKKLGIRFDIFSRTSYKIHHHLVKEFYKVLWDKGYIEERDIKQLYCPNCKKVLPDRFITGTCPVCGAYDQYGESCEKCASWYESYELIEPKCTICNSRPLVIDSTHFFLKLSQLNQVIIEYIKPRKDWRKSTYNKTISWLENEGLKDKDITRDYDWGPQAPFPGAEKQVIYNWAENLLGYISATKHHAHNLDAFESWKDYWMNDDCKLYCFIGKDNLFFHTILFPALLIAHGDYILPENVIVNEFVNLEEQKISTSRGWVVWLHEMLESFHPDMIRFYAAINAPESRDTDFKWKDFQTKINNELIATLGNYVHRVLSFTYDNFDASIPYIENIDDESEHTLRLVLEKAANVKNHIENFRFQAGLRSILGVAQIGNQYLNQRQPWRYKETAPTTIYTALQIVYTLSILLSPYLPFTAEKILEHLNIHKPKRLSWQDIEARIIPGTRIEKSKPLYRKITDEEIEIEISQLNQTMILK
jgi:methionyl-tRNA synthetase